VLQPLLPEARKPGQPPHWSRRQLIDGIGWRIRTATPWRDLPDYYGHWRPVYGLYRGWQRDGTWARILSALPGRADASDLITWEVSVDATIALVHQHAAGARRRPDLQIEPPGDEPDDHALDRSRGGWTPSCIWPASRATRQWLWSSPVGGAGTTPLRPPPGRTQFDPKLSPGRMGVIVIGGLPVQCLGE